MKIYEFHDFSLFPQNEKTPETLDFTGFSGGVFGVPEVIRTPDLPLRRFPDHCQSKSCPVHARHAIKAFFL